MRRSLLSIAVYVAGLVIVAMSAGGALAERRVALVIGNAAYQNASRLSNTINDAKAMTRLFIKAGFDVVETRTDLGTCRFRVPSRPLVAYSPVRSWVDCISNTCGSNLR